VRWTRRQAAGLIGAVATAGASAGADAPFRLGLTPVFLDNDADALFRLRGALEGAIARPVAFLQRRTYAEVTGLLLSGEVDAAWLCGTPTSSTATSSPCSPSPSGAARLSIAPI
jgi:phosphonate transport system substrate-binding protein